MKKRRMIGILNMVFCLLLLPKLTQAKETFLPNTDPLKTVQPSGKELISLPKPKATVVKSGREGTVDWELDSNNTLTLSSGTFNNSNVASSNQHRFRSIQQIIGSEAYNIEKVVFTGEVTVNSGTAIINNGGQGFFMDLEKLETIENIHFFRISKISSLRNFFRNTTIKNLDLTHWDTSNVTDMEGVFSNTSKLETINISNWQTGNVRTMFEMFSFATSLQQIDISNWDVSNVTDMRRMFANARSLKFFSSDYWKIYEDGYSRRQVKLEGMFEYASSLVSFSGKYWKNSRGYDVESLFHSTTMFAFTRSLQSVTFPETLVTLNGEGMFSNSGIQFLDLSSIRHLDGEGMFYYSDIKNLIMPSNLLLADVNSIAFQRETSVNSMFEGTKNLKTLDVSGWDMSHVRSAGFMFDSSAISELDLSNWELTSLSDGDKHSFNLESLPNYDRALASMFGGAKNLTTLDLSGFNTSDIYDMSEVFSGMTSLKTIKGLETWDTSNVLSMRGMFTETVSLTSIDDLSNWDVSHVISMRAMFQNTGVLNLNLENWKTSALREANQIFDESKFEKLNLANFDTRKLNNLNHHFLEVEELTIGDNFDLSNWMAKEENHFIGQVWDDTLQEHRPATKEEIEQNWKDTWFGEGSMLLNPPAKSATSTGRWISTDGAIVYESGLELFLYGTQGKGVKTFVGETVFTLPKNPMDKVQPNYQLTVEKSSFNVSMEELKLLSNEDILERTGAVAEDLHKIMTKPQPTVLKRKTTEDGLTVEIGIKNPHKTRTMDETKDNTDYDKVYQEVKIKLLNNTPAPPATPTPTPSTSQSSTSSSSSATKKQSSTTTTSKSSSSTSKAKEAPKTSSSVSPKKETPKTTEKNLPDTGEKKRRLTPVLGILLLTGTGMVYLAKTK